eukprot:1160914-Pelagomonas_calceolata.AAC.5
MGSTLQPNQPLLPLAMFPLLTRAAHKPAFIRQTLLLTHLQLVDVEGRGSFRERQVQRDGPRYAQLINADVGVARDDCARRKVDALAHEVAPDAAFFALEALRDGLDGAAALLHAWGHAGDGVIHVCGDVVLRVSECKEWA